MLTVQSYNPDPVAYTRYYSIWVTSTLPVFPLVVDASPSFATLDKWRWSPPAPDWPSLLGYVMYLQSARVPIRCEDDVLVTILTVTLLSFWDFGRRYPTERVPGRPPDTWSVTQPSIWPWIITSVHLSELMNRLITKFLDESCSAQWIRKMNGGLRIIPDKWE